jgi:hypothetical protein
MVIAIDARLAVIRHRRKIFAFPAR